MGTVLCSAFCAWLFASAPVIDSFTDVKGNYRTQFAPGETVIINGSGFGKRPGRVAVAWLRWPVIRWTPNQITIRAPEYASKHPVAVAVWTRSGKVAYHGGFSIAVVPTSLRVYDRWTVERWNWCNPDRQVAFETIEEVRRSLLALRLCRAAQFPECSLSGLRRDLYTHAARVPDELRWDLWGDLTREIGEITCW